MFKEGDIVIFTKVGDWLLEYGSLHHIESIANPQIGYAWFKFSDREVELYLQTDYFRMANPIETAKWRIEN